MKILFICNKSPWPPKEGGPIAMNALIEGLSEAGHQVKVLAVNSFKYNIQPENIPLSYKHQTNIELIDVDLRIKPFDAFLNLFSSKSYHVQRFISRKFQERLTAILKSEKFDIVQIEMVFMAPYVETVRKYSKAKIVLRAHNIEHLIWQRIASEEKNPLKKWYINHLAKTLKNFELTCLDWFDGIAAITPKDEAFFSMAVCNTLTTTIPFGINIEKHMICDKPKDRELSFFHIGAMNWIPNQEGIKWFIDHVWMKFNSEFPEIKFYLAGREMPEWLLNTRFPGIEVVGEVEDAHQFICSHNVMIVPLFSGSGIRIKIIEGMASGKTIITTEIGAEGITYTNQENILICRTAQNFLEAMRLCVSNPGKVSEIGLNARKLIELEHSNSKIIETLLRFYKAL